MPDAHLDLLTSALALLAAAQFAAGTLLVKRGLQYADSITGATIQIAVSMVVFALAAPFTIQASDWLSPAVGIFAALGLLRPSVSTMLANEGTRRLGPTISTTMESMSPFFAVLGGVLVLSERLATTTAVGTLGVVAGVAVLSARGRLPRAWSTWALLFPLGAALIRSGAHVAAKMGLLLLPNVVLSGLVAYTVSFVVALGVRSARPAAARPRPSREALLWFVLSGITNAGAIFALNSALMLGQVVLVSPVVAAYPVFTILGSRLFFRQDPITGRMVLALLLVVPSVMLITLGR
jgi:drug/metabolite transporter (DMT)-like permease